jgi:hypothetical protein
MKDTVVDSKIFLGWSKDRGNWFQGEYDTVGQKNGWGVTINLTEGSLCFQKFLQGKGHGPFVKIRSDGKKETGHLHRGLITDTQQS